MTGLAEPRPGRTSNPELVSTFRRAVDEGHARLTRSWPALIATGAVGGADVSLGVFAFYVVDASTHSRLLGALAFASGFVAITLSGSELFTENFLVPVAAVVARDASLVALVRLWAVTLVANLGAGWVITWLIVAGFPGLRHAAVDMARHAQSQSFGWTSVANAILAGAVITLMTWMERSTESVPGKLAAAVMAGFLLVAGEMNHSIVGSLEMFGGLHAGLSSGYPQWLDFLGTALLGNLAGGLILVTVLRLVQVGGAAIRREQERDLADAVPGGERSDEPGADGLRVDEDGG